MKSSTYSHALWAKISVLLLYCSSAGILFVRAADPDPLLDVAPAANENFVFRDVYRNGDNSNGPGGLRSALDINLFPALTSQGITYVHFWMKPCGENLPHSHPRATELLTMISGGPLQVGVVNTSGDPHIYIIYPGDLVVFPRGLLHYELNVGDKDAFYISALNSENPGVLTSAISLLSIPTRAAAGALKQDVATTEGLQSNIAGYSVSLQIAAGCVPNENITTTFR